MNKKVVTTAFVLSAMFAALTPVCVYAQGGLSAAEQKQFVDFHNKARVEVGVGPVTWSEKLTQSAQNWANRLASIGRMEHSQFGEGRPGENLAYGFPPHFKAIDGAKMWYDEKKLFTPGTKVDSQNYQVWGHYSQMVWSRTTEIGVGVASGNGQLFVVCHYNPGGNMMGYAPYGPGAQVNHGADPAAPSNLATVQPMKVQPSQPQPAAPSAQSGFPKGYFYMTTRWNESRGLVLESAPVTLRQRANLTGMFWRAIPANNGYFYLTSQYFEEKNQVLEGSDGSGAAVMVPNKGYSGTMWKAVSAGDGFYYLSSAFMEPQGKVLESNSGDASAGGDKFKGGPFMINKKDASQGAQWKFVPLD